MYICIYKRCCSLNICMKSNGAFFQLHHRLTCKESDMFRSFAFSLCLSRVCFNNLLCDHQNENLNLLYSQSCLGDITIRLIFYSMLCMIIFNCAMWYSVIWVYTYLTAWRKYTGRYIFLYVYSRRMSLQT